MPDHKSFEDFLKDKGIEFKSLDNEKDEAEKNEKDTEQPSEGDDSESAMSLKDFLTKKSEERK
jgi:hypothetical protein